MIDSKLKPWLIEVNHLSSFGTDSPLDKKIKFDLIQDTFSLLNLSVKRKKKVKTERAEQFSKRMHKDLGLSSKQKQDIKQKHMQLRDAFEAAHPGNFKRVFPSESEDLQDKYEMLVQHAQTLYTSQKQARELPAFQVQAPKTTCFNKTRTFDLISQGLQKLQAGKEPVRNMSSAKLIHIQQANAAIKDADLAEQLKKQNYSQEALEKQADCARKVQTIHDHNGSLRKMPKL